MRIGITLTSSLSVGENYIELTRQVAEFLAHKDAGIVYGGTAYGMMLALAEAYKNADGKDLVGVMAKDLSAVTKGYTAYPNLDESHIEDTMGDRTHRILLLSDAFIILPGGYGTFEEIGAIIGDKINKLHDKPIALYNYDHFYDTLIAFMFEMHQKSFSKIAFSDVVYVSESMDDIYTYFTSYDQAELPDKFVH